MSTTSPYAMELRSVTGTRKRYFLIAAVVLVLDQLTKWLIVHNLDLRSTVSVIPGIFQIAHVENEGAAFGLFANSTSEWHIAGLIVFSTVALVVISILLWRNGHKFTYGGFALALVLGGALGNLWDRVFLGHVVDFLDFYVGSAHWPAFNVADSAIVVGAMILVFEILFLDPSEERQRR